MASIAEPAPALDAAAVERLYERHGSRVFGYCLRMLGSREEAEDAAQTTFLQACGAIRRGAVPRFEAAWLLAIAKNVCLARHRSRGRRREVEIPRDPADLAELAPAGHAPESIHGLADAVARLPERQRHALLLREWHGCSYEEIGEQLGLTCSAVESLLFRARQNLASELDPDRRTWRSLADLGWLVGAVKSALGGGATVKLAAGAAAVAAGVGVASSVVLAEKSRPAPPNPAVEQARVRAQPALRRSVGTNRPAAGTRTGRATPAKRTRAATMRDSSPVAAGVQRPETAARREQPAAPTPAPSPAAEDPAATPTPTPASESPAPAPSAPSAPPPATPPASAPEPVAPTAPSAPDPVGVVEGVVSQVPLPVEVPEVPSAPQVPGVPKIEVPRVEVPAIPGVPILPKP